MIEKKYIITKDLKHFKSETSDHFYIAKNNGYDITDVIETGLFVDGKIHILECYNQKHLEKIKHTDRFIANDVNDFLNELTNRRILKARQAETLYKYGYTRQGD